jgi:hypothetical protein
MTLQEKICEPFGGLKTETVNELEQIVVDFAIGFAEWMNKTENRLGYHETKNRWYHFDSGKWITTKELLETYKKTL